MEYKINYKGLIIKFEELEKVPDIPKDIPCVAVRRADSKKVAIEKLENKIRGGTDGKSLKIEGDKKYLGYIYFCSGEYEAIIISLPKSIDCDLFPYTKKD